MRWRRLRRWLSILCVLLVIIVCLTLWYPGNPLIAPANHTVGSPPADLNAVTTTIPSDSGSNLATWYIPAASAHATLILLHPIRGDRRSMLGRARLFHDAGYAVLLPDLQAHGESPGQQITMGYLECHDVRAAVDYVRKTNPTHRIAIVGWSLGGAATILASPLGVDAVVLESVYPTIAEAIHDRVAIRLGPLSYALSPLIMGGLRLRTGISPADLRPIDHINQLGCPVLILSGDADQHTTIAETQRLYDAAQQPKKLVIFPGAAHVDLLEYNRAKYRSELLSTSAARALAAALQTWIISELRKVNPPLPLNLRTDSAAD